MDKERTLQKFWSGFGLKAYDELTVPDDAKFPYLTYSVATDIFDHLVPLSVSLWYNETTWENVVAKTEEIGKALVGGKIVLYDGGAVWINKGSPFSQRMRDDNDKSVKRMYLNLTAEYFSL